MKRLLCKKKTINIYTNDANEFSFLFFYNVYIHEKVLVQIQLLELLITKYLHFNLFRIDL
jgi:hypothetical protein